MKTNPAGSYEKEGAFQNKTLPVACGPQTVARIRFFVDGRPCALAQGKEVSRDGSIPCCRPLTAYLQNRAGLWAAGECPFILTVDWLVWVCYLLGKFVFICQAF